NYIKPYAVKIAAAKGQEELYVSLMMGQAAHESDYGRSGLASPPYYNLSGVKGSYNGEYVKMWTWEEVDGQVVEVLANFRKYPSYEQALQDYASKMRNGLSYDPLNYAGTWMKNASTYEQAIKGLSSGTSPYATDSKYFSKVLNVIKENELYKYDSNYYEDILSTKNISYEAVINRKTDSINTKPYGTKGYSLVSRSDKYYDKVVTVSKEAVTSRASWALISINGKEIGWIDKAGLDIYDQIKSTKTIAYSAKINRSTDSINSIAWGTAKNKVLGK
ncbi:glucosaminidase domain-containing protein, partial [Carnobacterium sp.]|uniref:glucosaminidase domain-containing protein n=1 Tax=Carnobacterium sp. TaxID=48221 RepID=UPI0028A694DE